VTDFSFTPEQKQTIVQRAQACCEYCISQLKFSPDTQMIGITPTGRATIERLNLNREGVVNLRAVLSLINWHPPF
jgi:hypothetical protein